MLKVYKTKSGESYYAEYQRYDGFGFERRYYRTSDLASLAFKHGWPSLDEIYSDYMTIGEWLVIQQAIQPYRIVNL